MGTIQIKHMEIRVLQKREMGKGNGPNPVQWTVTNCPGTGLGPVPDLSTSFSTPIVPLCCEALSVVCKVKGGLGFKYPSQLNLGYGRYFIL